MVKTNNSEFILEKYRKYICPSYNEYVAVMKNETMPEEHKLAETIYALQRFAENIKLYISEVKDKIAFDMQENGVTGYKTDNLNISLAQSVPSCIVTDPDIIARQYPELMNDPQPNKIEIAKRLRKGELINGAVLSNGGPPHLRISVIKQNINPYAKGNLS